MLGPAPPPACHRAAIFPEGLGQWRAGLGPGGEGTALRRGPAGSGAGEDRTRGSAVEGAAGEAGLWPRVARVRLDLGGPVTTALAGEDWSEVRRVSSRPGGRVSEVLGGLPMQPEENGLGSPATIAPRAGGRAGGRRGPAVRRRGLAPLGPAGDRPDSRARCCGERWLIRESHSFRTRKLGSCCSSVCLECCSLFPFHLIDLSGSDFEIVKK